MQIRSFHSEMVLQQPENQVFGLLLGVNGELCGGGMDPVGIGHAVGDRGGTKVGSSFRIDYKSTDLWGSDWKSGVGEK